MIDNLLLALESLRANKLRSFLTMLGIIIGISSVISIISLGNVVTASVTNQMQGLGVNNVTVGVHLRSEEAPSPYDETLSAVQPKDKDRFSMQQIESMLANYPDIEAISLTEELGRGKARIGRKYSNMSLIGVNPGYSRVNNIKLLQGRTISDADVQGNRSVIVISDQTAQALYGSSGSAIGGNVSVYMERAIKQFTIIGIYRYEQSQFMTSSSRDIETNGFIPVTSAKKEAAFKNFAMITIMPHKNTDINLITGKLDTYVKHLTQSNSDWEGYAFNMQSEVESMTTMMRTLSVAVAVIAGISLLVGGIGVMNIMLVSVTERTHEIGVRKALGARDHQIRQQFVAEAMMLSLVGGIIGIMIGLLAGAGGALLMNTHAVFSPAVIGGTVLFSMSIGVFFGYYPANQAAKLNPIDALRYE
ncbi:ABC transporter permease [Paenibacillus sp. MMS20-IR301]|uniref:ABC transporter permease n=1 Tax=Paenibacillus sp. MMS20-IR301 TaxID=2895946 RepID=UPI0028E63191|nr:ABC transporter permease [Paenibacillus sp. MMS20-IR301]WNS45207.1 ABC transporter permease [Paenibacillus sp. MMS20-IR301]